MNKCICENTLAIIFDYKLRFELCEAQIQVYRDALEDWREQLDKFKQTADKMDAEIKLWRKTVYNSGETGYQRILYEEHFMNQFGQDIDIIAERMDWYWSKFLTTQSILDKLENIVTDDTEPHPQLLRKCALQIRDLSDALTG